MGIINNREKIVKESGGISLVSLLALFYMSIKFFHGEFGIGAHFHIGNLQIDPLDHVLKEFLEISLVI